MSQENPSRTVLQGVAWAGLLLCFVFAAPVGAHEDAVVDATAPPPEAMGYWFPEATYKGPMGHAPIGVMADHAHRKGEWMLSARYMNMQMHRLADGTSRLSSQEVTSPTGAYDYLVAPTRMTTQMLMVGAMYAPIDQLTLMVMLPYQLEAHYGMVAGAVERVPEVFRFMDMVQ